jgi:hypothetical protein
MYLINPYIHSNLNETPAILNDGNTVGWWDSNVLSSVTVDASNKVSNWADISGAGHDLLQTNDALKPVFSENGIEFIQTRALRTNYFPLPQPITMYIVMDLGDPTNYVFDGYSSDSVIFYNGGVEPYAGKVVRPLSPEPGLIVRRLLYNGINSKFMVGDGIGLNGNYLRTITGDVGTNAMNGLTLGSRWPIGYGGTFNIKEVIIRKVADVDIDHTAIYNYLNAKYNILGRLQM